MLIQYLVIHFLASCALILSLCKLKGKKSCTCYRATFDPRALSLNSFLDRIIVKKDRCQTY